MPLNKETKPNQCFFFKRFVSLLLDSVFVCFVCLFVCFVLFFVGFFFVLFGFFFFLGFFFVIFVFLTGC